MRIKCRQLDREGTEREVEVHDPDFAPDTYAYEYVKFDSVGNVTFIESLVDGEWVLWSVEVAKMRPLMLVTMRTTHAEARAEITQAEATEAYCIFRGVKLVLVESNPGASRIVQWHVGAQNQMPMTYVDSAVGMSSTLFAPEVRDNELDIDTMQVGLSSMITFQFDRPGRVRGTLFGLALL